MDVIALASVIMSANRYSPYAPHPYLLPPSPIMPEPAQLSFYHQFTPDQASLDYQSCFGQPSLYLQVPPEQLPFSYYIPPGQLPFIYHVPPGQPSLDYQSSFGQLSLDPQVPPEQVPFNPQVPPGQPSLNQQPLSGPQVEPPQAQPSQPPQQIQPAHGQSSQSSQSISPNNPAQVGNGKGKNKRGAIRRRNRRSRSCSQCRQRNLQCDRSRNCVNCRLSGRHCDYSTNHFEDGIRRKLAELQSRNQIGGKLGDIGFTMDQLRVTSRIGGIATPYVTDKVSFRFYPFFPRSDSFHTIILHFPQSFPGSISAKLRASTGLKHASGHG